MLVNAYDMQVNKLFIYFSKGFILIVVIFLIYYYLHFDYLNISFSLNSRTLCSSFTSLSLGNLDVMLG